MGVTQEHGWQISVAEDDREDWRIQTAKELQASGYHRLQFGHEEGSCSRWSVLVWSGMLCNPTRPGHNRSTRHCTNLALRDQAPEGQPVLQYGEARARQRTVPSDCDSKRITADDIPPCIAISSTLVPQISSCGEDDPRLGGGNIAWSVQRTMSTAALMPFPRYDFHRDLEFDRPYLSNPEWWKRE